MHRQAPGPSHTLSQPVGMSPQSIAHTALYQTPPAMRQQPSPRTGPMMSPGMAPMSNPMYSSGGVAPRVGSAGPQMPNAITSPRMGPTRSPGMGPMSNPMLPPRPGSSGPQMPNMMLYQSAGDSGPASNDLYRSYEQFAGGLDPRMYASGGGSAGPMQRATVAQQFVQSFGGFGPHGQAKGVGVGIRVEFNEARDLVVARVNDGGSAQRDGTVRVGDILLAVGQTPVKGKTLVQLRPFMIGPRGSLVTLTFRRGVEGTGEFSEYTIELVRGDNFYFLQVENQMTASKLEIFKSNINEVEMEMDSMRTVLAHAQGRAKMTEGEVQTMQTRYRQLQNAIEKCNGDIAEERQMQGNLRSHLKTSESENPYKEHLRNYHEKLTHVEATLGEVMSELAGEHEVSCRLLTELDQEQKIAEMISEKIRNHEGIVARSAEHNTSIEDVIAQRYAEIESLKNQIAETQAKEKRIEQELEAEVTGSDDIHAKVALAQKNRTDLEGQLDSVRAAVMEAESEQKQEIQKGQRLWEKQELVRAVADKRQQASGGLQKSMELEDERKETMLKEAKAERRRLRDGAFYRQQDLRMQIDTIKDINVQLQNKILAMATEHESAQQNLKFQAKLSEDNLEAKRNETDTIKDDFEKIAQQIREAQQHTLEAKDATAVHDQDEEKHLADISAVHRNVADMDREFHHLFQVEKTREDYSRALWHEHEDYLHSVQIAVDQAKYNMEEIRGAETRTQQEMQRCRKAMEKMAEVRNAFSHRKSIFRNKQLEHLRDTEHTFQRHHNGLREQLAALSALNPDNFFKISQVTNNAISDALQNVEKIKHDYAAARARVDAEHTPWGGEMQTAHQHPFLTHQYRTRDMQESDLRHGMQPEAFAASGGYSGPSSYTDQLVARSGGEAMASQNSRAIFPTPVSAGFSSHSPASQPQGRANDDTVGLNGPITNTQLFYPPSESMRASFTSGNAHSIESTPALMSAPSPSPMQRSAPPPMGLRNSNQDFPRVLHVESVPTGLLRASFSSSTLSPGHEGVSDVSGSMGSRGLSSASLRDELHKAPRPTSPRPGGLSNGYTNVAALM